MTLLAPVFFWWALAAAAGVIAAHLLVTRQPPSHPLPTVRFVPAAAVRSTAITRRPEDQRLLLLRVLIVLAIGTAFARPILVPARRSVARVLLWDRSAAVATPQAARDSVTAWFRKGDVIIGFDSAARVLEADADTASSSVPGRLSPALIAAYRAAAGIRASADSIELIVISPIRDDEWDAATPAIRALWPGRIRLVGVSGVVEARARLGHPVVDAGAGDPVAVGVQLLEGTAGDSTVRVVRRAPLPSDSLWATEGSRALVRWPASGAPPGWQAVARLDTANALIVGGAALVYPFERRWQPGNSPAEDRVIARWTDGGVAATERRAGAGCIRDVAIPVARSGDLVLRRDFGRMLRSLTAPCRMAGVDQPVAAVDSALFAGSGSLAATSTIRPSESAATPLVPWLLAIAVVLSLLELALRRRGTALSLEAEG